MFILTVLLSGCRKKRPPVYEEGFSTELISGLPSDVTKANGYFYTSCLFRNYKYQRWLAFATFSDPNQNLLAGFNHYQNYFSQPNAYSGNVDVGAVHLDTVKLDIISHQTHQVYKHTAHAFLSLSYTPRWQIEGNRSFLQQDIVIPSYYPRLNDTQVTKIYKSQEFHIDLEKGFSHYDSVRVFLISGNAVNVSKCVSANGPKTLSFFPADMVSIKEAVIYFQCYGFKYFHQWRNGKLYIYEISTMTSKAVIVEP